MPPHVLSVRVVSRFSWFISFVSPKVVTRLLAVGVDGGQLRTAIHLRAVGAGSHPALQGALAYLAQGLAEEGLAAVGAAAVAADVLGQDGYIVQLGP